MTDLTQLFEFLSSPNPAARQIALENLVGHTGKSDPQRHIFIPSLGAALFVEEDTDGPAQASGSGLGGGQVQKAEEDKIKVGMLRDLCTLCQDQAAVSKLALEALINLSDTPAVARHLVTPFFLTFLVSYTCNTTSILSSLTSMLLSNISSHHSLLSSLANLYVPLVPLPNASKKDEGEPTWYLPAGISASSTVHRDYRDPTIVPPNKEAGQGDERPVEAIRALVQAFEDGAAQGVKEGKGKRKGECHFLASVFANISTLPSTRQLLLTPYPPFPLPSSARTSSSEPLLSKIAPFTSHPDTIRRGGALAAIKNIALDRACHAFLLAGEEDRVRLPPGVLVSGGGGVKRDAEGRVIGGASGETESDKGKGAGEDEEEDEEEDEKAVDEQVGREEVVRGVDVLPAVLGPLMGGEEYDIEDMDKLPPTLQFLSPDKQREADTVLRMMCIEILLLLATTFTGRKTLRERGTYPVVRELHKWEKDQPIKEAVERLVSLIEGDESRDTANDHVEELVKGLSVKDAKAAVPTTTTTTTAPASVEEVPGSPTVTEVEEDENDVVEV